MQPNSGCLINTNWHTAWGALSSRKLWSDGWVPSSSNTFCNLEKIDGLTDTAMTTFKTIFVTVGTTKFDALIREVDSVVFQRFITETLKTTTLIVQYGNSVVVSRESLPSSTRRPEESSSPSWSRLSRTPSPTLSTLDARPLPLLMLSMPSRDRDALCTDSVVKSNLDRPTVPIITRRFQRHLIVTFVSSFSRCHKQARRGLKRNIVQ